MGKDWGQGGRGVGLGDGRGGAELVGTARSGVEKGGMCGAGRTESGEVGLARARTTAKPEVV